MTKKGQRQDIVDAAIDLAELGSWESVRLREVATQLGIGLDEISAHFHEKDELVDAWFDRADDAVLALADNPKLEQLSARERLFTVIMTWLDALAPHRRVTRQMVQAKLEPGHVHIQIPALMRVSRTVQWMREVASLEDAGLRRALTETVTTTIVLAVFARWLTEERHGSPATRRLLDRMLRQAEVLARTLPGFSREQTHTAPTEGKPDHPAWTP